jgi:hypothetical protein
MTRKSDNIATSVTVDTPDIGSAEPSTWMNPSAIRLFLALLWFAPGVGFLVHDLWTGQILGVPFGRWTLPFAVLCLILAAFNFVRWWAGRSRPTPLTFRPRHVQRSDDDAEPDPTFRFDEPSAGPDGRET